MGAASRRMTLVRTTSLSPIVGRQRRLDLAPVALRSQWLLAFGGISRVVPGPSALTCSTSTALRVRFGKEPFVFSLACRPWTATPNTHVCKFPSRTEQVHLGSASCCCCTSTHTHHHHRGGSVLGEMRPV